MKALIFPESVNPWRFLFSDLLHELVIYRGEYEVPAQTAGVLLLVGCVLGPGGGTGQADSA